MNARSHKALVINGFWATVFAGLVSAIILGGIAFAANVYADTTALKEQVSEIKQASLPSRMSRLEGRVDDGFEAQGKTLERLEKKIDRIEQGLQGERKSR